MKQSPSRRIRRSTNTRRFTFEVLEHRRLLATFQVLNNLDSGPGSLRQAILDANLSSGADQIAFNVNGGGHQIIAPTTDLPPIIDTVVIDGTTQPGYAGTPLIELSSAGGAVGNGLFFAAGSTGSVVQALAIGGFDSAIYAENASGLKFQSNLLGTDTSGGTAVPNRIGITLRSSSNSIIGTDGDGINDALEGNLISGNSTGIEAVAVPGLRISGNKIGTDLSGNSSVANALGVYVVSDDTFIGTNGDGVSDSLEGNLISGNSDSGIYIIGSRAKISGNIVGLDVSGTSALPNSATGISLNYLTDSLVGTDGDGVSDSVERNIVSANGAAGIAAFTVSNTRIAGNWIGLDASGSQLLANTTQGIFFHYGSSNNIVGTNSDGQGDLAERNVIVGSWTSLRIEHPDSSNNRVSGNYIGVDPTGMIAMPGGTGVYLADAGTNNLVGTNSDGTLDAIERNVIAGLSNTIYLNRSHNSVVAGNLINVNIAEQSLGGFTAIIIDGSDNSQIGGNSTDAANTMTTAAGGMGIWLLNSSSNNSIVNNNIGRTSSGSSVTVMEVSIAVSSGTGNTFLNNRFGDVSYMGIENTTWDGPNINDLQDADTGANDLQNYPVIAQAFAISGNLNVSGTFNGEANTTIEVEFYTAETALSGVAYGVDSIGTLTLTTDANGDATFSTILAGAFVAGDKISALATSAGGSTSEFAPAFVVSVPLNLPPSAEIGGPYNVSEGGAIVLDASLSSDPDQATTSLTFEWDLDNDGLYGETGSNATFGNEIGIAPTFDATELDGTAAYPISLRVIDNFGATSSVSSVVTVYNVAPTALITGPSSSVATFDATFVLSASDPSQLDQAAGFVFQIDWNGDDIVDQTVSGGNLSITHSFSAPGTYSITVVAIDKDGGTSSEVVLTHTVATVGLAVDSWNPTGTVIQVTGTGQDDEIKIRKTSSQYVVSIRSDSGCHDREWENYSFSIVGITRIVVHAGDGDDEVQVADSVSIATELHGQAGDDELDGGSGPNLMLGGSGNDELKGGNGRDILIGGLGRDELKGKSGSDLLIGAYTLYDENAEALAAIFAEWNSDHTLASRIANLGGTGASDRLNGSYYLTLAGSAPTVINDNDKDEIEAKNNDWVLAHLYGPGKDKVKD